MPGEREETPHTDQWRRHELVRLHALPVRARIIVRPGGSSSPGSQTVISRGGFENEIDFTVSPPFVRQNTSPTTLSLAVSRRTTVRIIARSPSSQSAVGPAFCPRRIRSRWPIVSRYRSVRASLTRHGESCGEVSARVEGLPPLSLSSSASVYLFLDPDHATLFRLIDRAQSTCRCPHCPLYSLYRLSLFLWYFFYKFENRRLNNCGNNEEEER